MNNKARERVHKQIMKCVKELAEGYDSVQIFLTKHSDIDQNLEDTESLYFGIGNKFAIYGQIKNWVLTEEKKMINIADLEFNAEMGENSGEEPQE